MNLRERLEREERRRQVAYNVRLYQLSAICGMAVLVTVAAVVWAIASV